MAGQDSMNLMLSWLTFFDRQVQFRSRKISVFCHKLAFTQ